MANKKMKWWQKTAAVLAGVGALNWGLAALGFNVVEKILGVGNVAAFAYYLIGVSGAYTLFWFFSKK